MNQPDRFELYLLGPGQKKLNIVPDPVIPNACLVTVEKEDHTLGNLLRGQLLRDPRVTFVGYRLPHPLVNALELRIQTKPDCDVKTCLSDALLHLVSKIDILIKKLSMEVEGQKLQPFIQRKLDEEKNRKLGQLLDEGEEELVQSQFYTHPPNENESPKPWDIKKIPKKNFRQCHYEQMQSQHHLLKNADPFELMTAAGDRGLGEDLTAEKLEARLENFKKDNIGVVHPKTEEGDIPALGGYDSIGGMSQEGQFGNSPSRYDSNRNDGNLDYF